MAAAVKAPKTSPEDVARQILEALASGREEVVADDFSREVKDGLAAGVYLTEPAAPSKKGPASAGPQSRRS